MTSATETKFSWKTLQNEYTVDGPGIPGTPRIAEGILPYSTAPVAFCIYRQLLAHRYNLLIRPDASVIEIGCGTGELLNGLHAARKMAIEQIAGG